MRLPNTDPTIEISTGSGVLRVTVHPAQSWPVILLELGVLTAFAAVIYGNWTKLSYEFRGLFIFALVFAAAGLIFQFSGTETIDIDTNKIALCKDVHGWERKREYGLNECRELEWTEGTEDTSQRLQFKTGWKTVTFGNNLTENQAIEILTALQQALPNVAQQLCSYPEGKKHFITLGLS
ncbi:MAG: hypothetical protein WA817_23135 [Candidatus Acidiferrum sp.]